MVSKVVLLLCLLAIVLFISSEVAAKDSTQTSTTSQDIKDKKVDTEIEDAKHRRFPGGGYGGGYPRRGYPGRGYGRGNPGGGYPGGGYGGNPGGGYPGGGYGGNPGGGYGGNPGGGYPGGGYGGNPGGGYGGYPGGGRGGGGYGGGGGPGEECNNGCCYRGYNGCSRCCDYAGQAVQTHFHNKPLSP
ncbi:hypothetical protein SOVF_163850 [Spinacia oleracea]|uniref:Glycine-rich cell wall structural protein n=1 Tax=Spinacia oleracea TaxID=3562 RepID=A0A9R0IMR9_SPIOL|nr:glycine-rich cell wall structural protein-like [Spinacia oleracea]KNA08298.1 hypothetical protein SOVF_163850 [Spinacia oleracea]